ncbi:O-antigen polymerase [Clostridium neuense]|uniref:O-antigen polymerase n=1 Tax=Clostridium neuense TaxID=1728934 RepID=A0ABW8T9P1_9CLOT
MLYFINAILTIILILSIYKDYKKYNILFVADSNKLSFIMWTVTLILYNLSLSNLYNPDLYINLLVLPIVIIFFIGSRIICIKNDNIGKLVNRFYEENWENVYGKLSIVFLIIAIISLGINFKINGIAILSENKINKQSITTLGYGVFIAVIAAQIQYLIYRKNKRIKNLLLCSIAVICSGLTLSRGPLFYFVLTVFIFEIYNLYFLKIHCKHGIRNIKIKVLAIIFIFIFAFNYVGNIRNKYVMDNFFHHTLNEHYMMKKNYPTAFTQLYIYLTSPLENARFSIENQSVENMYFNELLYPIVKFNANIIGEGNRYKEWIDNKQQYIPYLDDLVGLNVSSFIVDAFNDYGYLGYLVYMFLFFLLSISLIKLINSNKHSSVFNILLYSNALNFLLWNVFVNSFKVGTQYIYIVCFIFCEFFYKIKKSKYSLKLRRRKKCL